MRPCRPRNSAPTALRLFVVLMLAVGASTTGLARLAGATGISVASSSSGQASARTSITLNRPAGTQAGHVMLASLVANGDSGGFSPPNGWGLVREDVAGKKIRQAIYLKVAGAGEPESYTWSLADWRRIAGGITTYQGVDTAQPVDAHHALTASDVAMDVTAPSLDATVPGTLLVHFAAVSAEGTISPPPGMTERFEATSPNPDNDRDVKVASSDEGRPDDGPTGPRTATASAPGARIGAALLLRPTETPPPPDDDTTPPETSIDGGPTGTVGIDSVTFEFSADEAGSTFECRLDGEAFVPCGSPRTYTGLAEGEHWFAVRATDPSGNTDPEPATRSWIVDLPDGVITVVGSAASESSTSHPAITVSRPSGTEPGDVMVAVVAANGDVGSISGPDGWVLLRDDTVDGAVRQGIWVKVAGTPEPSSYTWQLGSWRRVAAGITTYAGVNTSDPVVAHAAHLDFSGSANVTSPTIDVAIDNAMLLQAVGANADASVTPPGSMTERFEANSPNPSNSRDVSVALADEPLGPPGPTGSRATTLSSGGPSVGAAVALRPDGPPPSPSPDTDPPETTIDAGPTGTVASTSAAFQFSADEPGVTFSCSLDADPAEFCTSPKSYSGLANGTHTFTVAATDAAGNTDPEPAQRTWTVKVSTDPVLVGAGDISSCSNTHDEETAQLLDQVVAANPDTRVFTAGDNVYGTGTASEFANCYDPTWGRHKDRTLPAPGNHDYATPGASGYYGYFGAAAGEPTQGYYDEMVGDWHVIVLNSECGQVGGCHAGSPQEQWLRARLAAVDAECTAAIWHKPRFSSGPHGSSAAYEPFSQALYEHGAELVVVGHDHVYERFAPQTAGGLADATYGVRHITAGLGGRSIYSLSGLPVAPNSEVRYDDDYGVLKLTLHPAGYDWEFLRVGDAAVIDSGSTDCHPAPPVEPPPPPIGPITAVGTTSNGSSNSRPALTIARPAGLVSGHAMIASVVANGDVPGFTAPPGWTLVRDDATSEIRQLVYSKVATASEPSSYTWAISGNTTRRIAGGITAYSGVDTSQPVDAHGARRQDDPSPSATAPSITTTVAGTRLLHLSAVNAEGSVTPPGGMTERWEAASPNPGNNRDILAALADTGFSGPGPTGARTATTSQSGQAVAVALALRPAGVTPPPPGTPGDSCSGEWGPPTRIGELPNGRGETSGLVASPAHPGWGWTIRDSGNPASLYSFRLDGTEVTSEEFPVPGTSNSDWEDVAYTSGEGGEGILWILENVGNSHNGNRVIYQVAEPNPTTPGPAELLGRYEFAYPETQYNTEVLFAFGGRLAVIGKTTPASPVFLFDGPLEPAIVNRPTLVGDVPVGGTLSVGALSHDERVLAAASHYQVNIYVNEGDPTSLADLIANAPVDSRHLPQDNREGGDFFPHGSCDLVLIAESRSVWKLSGL